MSIHISVTGPFVDVVVTDVLSEDDLPRLFDAFDSARRRGPFVVLTDTIGMKSAPRPVIMHFADGLKKLPSMKELWLGDAVVIRSPLARFAISTLVLVAPLPTEIKVFEARYEAERWCAQILDHARIRVPEPLMTSSVAARR